MWDKLIQGFVIALIWLYQALGSTEWSLVLSITVLTIAVRLITIPFTVPSQQSMKKNSAKMQALQPELDKIKQKYAKEPQQLQTAQLELYKKHNINPVSSMAGCLPMFIQLPIIWAFYQSISRALANQPGQMLALTRYLSAVPRFVSLVPLPSRWLMFDLARPDMILLPLLVAGSTWLQQKLTMPNQPRATDAQAAQMQQSMSVTMPLMFGFFAMQMPAGLSIYFIVSNLIGMAIQWGTNRWLNKDGDTAPPTKLRTPRQDKPKEPSSPEPTKGRGYKKS